MSQIPIVQIGLGSFGNKWIDCIRRSDVFELVGVVDSRPEVQVEVRNQLKVPSFSTFGEAEKNIQFSAVLIATPPQTHFALAKAALETGKHVLVEKPFTNTLNEAAELVALATRYDRILIINQQYRFDPAVRVLASAIRSGLIGQLLSVRCRFDRDVQSLLAPTDFRIGMPHGLLLDMGIHHIDLLRALTGTEIARLYAEGWRMPNSIFPHYAAMTALLTLESGAVALYQGNWASSDLPTSWWGRWDIEGATGHLSWHPPVDLSSTEQSDSGTIMLRRHNGELRELTVPQSQASGLDGSLQSCATGILDGRQPETNGADNLKTLAAVLACTQSVEEHRSVIL